MFTMGINIPLQTIGWLLIPEATHPGKEGTAWRQTLIIRIFFS